MGVRSRWTLVCVVVAILSVYPINCVNLCGRNLLWVRGKAA